MMPDVSDFHLGADVIDNEGRKAGKLVSVIVDEKGFEPRALNIALTWWTRCAIS